MERNDNSIWVAERMGTTAPEWTPDAVRARTLLDGRLDQRLAPAAGRRAWIAAGALAGLAVAILALPQGRAVAQELTFRLFLNRVDVVRVDLSDLPFQTNVMVHDKVNANTYTNISFSYFISPSGAPGGVTLQLGATTGGATGSMATMYYDNVSIQAVPEPGTYALMLAGLAGVGVLAKRRRQA